MSIDTLVEESIALLRRMVATPSLSREEGAVCDLVQRQLNEWGLPVNRHGNNLWLESGCDRGGCPTVLLNSHLDTVKPASGYTRDPYDAHIEHGRLYGLGSNDAGGPLVALLAAYRFLTQRELPYRLIFCASCEEEVSGKGGLESVLPLLGRIDVGLVGEPTSLHPAVAEKGLMVCDCLATGVSGHAARNEGVNAIYRALPAIQWLQSHRFERISALLGPVKATVTMIDAGTQHNVIPDRCRFVLDVRVNELYSLAEVLDELRAGMPNIDIQPHSLRLNSSRIDLEHPLVQRALQLGLKPFGSPTLSDQALMPFPSLKLGPGDSERSHAADEWIPLDDIRRGAQLYVQLLNGLML